MRHLGIDVGGTFTDFVLMENDGSTRIYKVPTTPPDVLKGVINGLNAIGRSLNLAYGDFLGSLQIIVHGTTIATNALLTETGAKTALLTTSGFRDALQMRRGFREELYNNKYQAPKAIVPRHLRYPVDERIDFAGDILKKLNTEEVLKCVEDIKLQGVEAVAICFLHSYCNSSNESEAARIVNRELPGFYISASSELLPKMRFYDRISTTVLNAYVGPIVSNYLRELIAELKNSDFRGALFIMQSNGGVASPQEVSRKAVSAMLSGPAAGPAAGLSLASTYGHKNCLIADMGGTSFDVSLIIDGQPFTITDGKINRHLAALPMLDIHTIGAGGGSIGWIDKGGLLRVGPQSAGANPGPACYGLGGEAPTCTDANLVLGYLNADFFLGGNIKLDRSKAEKAIEMSIAKPLGLDVMGAAAGIFRVINENMVGGIRQVTVEKGHDPREFPLIVAGGAGPIHAAMIAKELAISQVIIPRDSSAFCALGMLLTDLKYDIVRTHPGLLSEIDRRDLNRLFEAMQDQARTKLSFRGMEGGGLKFLRSLAMRYEGQYHEVIVTLEGEQATELDLRYIEKKFEDIHEARYGYALRDGSSSIQIIDLWITAIGQMAKPKIQGQISSARLSPAGLVKGRRPIYLEEKRDFIDVAVYDGDRGYFSGQIKGPALVEKIATTVWVPEGFRIVCDDWGNYLMSAER